MYVYSRRQLLFYYKYAQNSVDILSRLKKNAIAVFPLNIKGEKSEMHYFQYSCKKELRVTSKH